MTSFDENPESQRRMEAWIIDLAIRLLIMGLVAYWTIKLVAPFVILVIWAAILATAIYPIHAWLRARLGGRSTPVSILITALGLALILGPAAALTASMAGTVESFSSELAAGTFVLPAPDPSVQDWPLIGGPIFDTWSELHVNLAGVAADNRDILVSTGRTLLGFAAGLGIQVLLFAAALIIAGFLYGRGPALAESSRRFASRAGGTRAAGFVDLAGATVRNVSRGVIGVSLLQALLAGIGLMVAGVPGAGLIALGVLILAIIQVGPAILLIPVTIWVWTAMDTLTAGLFTVYIIPVLLFDNILKPIVVARGLSTPMLVILIGVIGGTLAHGLIGLFLGPIVLAVAYEL
ncbi:MAG TPA: AI-2E family transporter, partial [Paracoccaceae bacterium]|nr:AI-2E family transporter [Paracoccaceae bacterium]